jgi:Zn-dependent protease with chaperone function
MALAAGVPMPQVYVLDQDAGINAFAAGHSPEDAAIGITRGGMTLLTRDELQGVIGHEFSHLLNGDMRLNIRIMGVLFGIVCLTVIGRVLLYARGGNRGRAPMLLLGVALLVIGALGVLFGRLIQAALSRQREMLADASAVQFTRNPAGLAGALRKIGRVGARIDSPHAGEVSHMFFENGLGKPVFGWLATHPPLAERIRALDPGWDGSFDAHDADPTAETTPERGSAAAATRP